MTSQNSSDVSRPFRCKGFRTDRVVLLFVKFLFIFSSVTIAADTTAGNTGYKNRTNRRWTFGTAHSRINRHGNTYSSSWKEIVDGNSHKNPHDDSKCSYRQKNVVKNRLGLFHFGKINKKSKIEGLKTNKFNEETDNKEEHPLRTNIWELELKWSFLSRKSNIFSGADEMKKIQREKNVQLELDPEGYCRIYEKISTVDNKDEDSSNSTVLAIGRWKKRPWGVTIVVRPLFARKSSPKATTLEINGDDGKRRNNVEISEPMESKDVNVIDEQTEFIFHANNFHWNGFGSNPKLTQGTILFQRQKKRTFACWWKNTQLAYSNILPMWPEEMSGGDGNYKTVLDNSDHFGVVLPGLLSLSGILNIVNREHNRVPSRRKWFRPVVGTFTAKGII